MSEKIKDIIYWKGKGFGESLILSRLVNILQDNGINVFFKEGRKTQGLIENSFPITYDDKNYNLLAWDYDIKIKKSIMQQYIEKAENYFNKRIQITKDYIPVKYYDISEIGSFDVILHSKTGNWTPYRNWAYFTELKILLKRNKITALDLAEYPIYGIKYLNYVNKSKLYVGLETGPSHYISQFMRGRCLILQGGFSTYDFWASSYGYEHLEIDIECKPCFINWENILNGKKCQFCNKCMMNIDPIVVFDKIKEMLK